MKYFGASIEKELGLAVDPNAAYHASNIYLSDLPNSVILDGTTDYMKVLDSDQLSMASGGGGSWCMWYKTANTSENFGFLSKGDGISSNTVEYRMFLLNNKVYFDTHTDTTGNYRRLTSAANTEYDDTNWHHICFTVGPGDIQGSSGNAIQRRIYLDGAEVVYDSTGSGGTYTGPNNESSDMWIGALEDTPNYDLDGNIMQVMKWFNYELNPQEVKYIYGLNGGVVTYPDPTINTAIYKGGRQVSLWLKCQSSTSFSYGGSSHTGIVNSVTGPIMSAHPQSGGVLMNDAAIDTNDSPTT